MIEDMKVDEIIKEINVERNFRGVIKELSKSQTRNSKNITKKITDQFKKKVEDSVKREEIVKCFKYCLEVEKNGN